MFQVFLFEARALVEGYYAEYQAHSHLGLKLRLVHG